MKPAAGVVADSVFIVAVLPGPRGAVYFLRFASAAVGPVPILSAVVPYWIPHKILSMKPVTPKKGTTMETVGRPFL